MKKYGTGEQVAVERDDQGTPVDPQGITVQGSHLDSQTFTVEDRRGLIEENRAVDGSAEG